MCAFLRFAQVLYTLQIALYYAFYALLQQQRKLSTNRRLIAAKLQAERGFDCIYLIEYAKLARYGDAGDYHIPVPAHYVLYINIRRILLQGAWWIRGLKKETIILNIIWRICISNTFKMCIYIHTYVVPEYFSWSIQPFCTKWISHLRWPSPICLIKF